MQKRLHKILVLIFVFCAFSINPTIAIEQNTNSNINDMNLVQNEINVKDLDIEPLNTQKVKNEVIPDTKKEGKKVIELFLKTMMIVAFCGVLLYCILLYVKKYYGGNFINEEYEEFESLDLTTPSTKSDALKAFLNRTK